MANGKLRDYYWRIKTFIAEHPESFDSESSAFRFPEQDDLVNFELIDAVLVFRDGSKLYVRAALNYETIVREQDYAYVYYDAQGNRIFQYDDAPHHPEIATHPHHLHRSRKSKREQILPLDVLQVNFITIVEKALERLKKAS